MKIFSTVSFTVKEGIEARFASHGPDHLCVAFWRNGKRVGSFCAELSHQMSYFSESRQVSTLVASFEDAVNLAEAEPV